MIKRKEEILCFTFSDTFKILQNARGLTFHSSECVVCGRCGQALVSLEPHTCPPNYVNLPNQPPQPAVSISFSSEGQVVSLNSLASVNVNWNFC